MGIVRNISSSQHRMKAYADKKSRDHPFKVGDRVLLAARQNQLPHGLSSKLSAKYYRPFPILSADGFVAFKLELPKTVNIHPIFHVSQLEPFLESSTPTEPTRPPPFYADRRGGIFEVESILAKRKIRNSWSYLVKWKGYDDFEITWEPLAHVRHLSDLLP